MISNLVGTRIRSLRSKKKMTQQQLADLADVPRATLATVERDDANPSLAVVYRIANALGVTIDHLVEESHQRIQVIQANQMQQIQSGDGVYRATTVSPANAFHFHQQLFSLAANTVYEGKPHPPGSEEFLHILEGEVVLEVIEETVHLQSGDSAIFAGNVKHTYINPGKKEARGVVSILEAGQQRNGISKNNG
ncbi:MAG: helix-turn-helix transcriptional regulator [Magnetococcales bacterium]|nr:helix-turn-helix transcriptional regulator [Magnetococcales bacterium]